ncbi:hypothetical protein [Pseudobacteroides cellulosolvens]|uniref:Uncharacterized protein n=1 Tax=Pseudobacteroides cellulosolvens ATCC 35603 = DSM 2933 TaxID=398512 RepID=A0A0L6JR40_9FIRM|nr:hypothetical protein [Pseudobacteroides cellulosolvens]KNY28249.1 hypothetical protein Bccel_3523 [Pseudobacteroides cellulosolvens ATCC 35603 = DSM 2933]
MFKKLFISLIILSALTTDGTAVFPAAYYDMLVFIDSRSDVLDVLNEGPSLAPNGDANGIISDDALNYTLMDNGFNIRYSVAFDIKEPLCKKGLFCGTNKYSLKNNLIESITELQYISILPSYKNKGLVINYTDSSPPSCYTV